VPPVSPARQTLLFEWQGRVDKEIRVQMRGNRTSVNRVGNREPGTGRVRNVGYLPNVDAQVRVEVVEGRGRVDIVQQPTRQNGYTAIFRVRDPGSGSDTYRIRAYTTASRGRGDDRGNGRDRGRGRDGDWDRDGRGGDHDGDWDRDRDGRHDDDDRDDVKLPGGLSWPKK
jgi:hypothetical protein